MDGELYGGQDPGALGPPDRYIPPDHNLRCTGCGWTGLRRGGVKIRIQRREVVTKPTTMPCPRCGSRVELIPADRGEALEPRDVGIPSAPLDPSGGTS